ncbi:hypothetical protein SPAR98_2518 [Streptococcus pneumoniae GA47502]|nr:hypothetical protein SPAR98_2518 [Streptococcus pneumoniae GA47502]
MRGYLHENLFLSHASRSESPNFESVGLFLFAIISILETVGFILSISVVEELRPRWLSLPLS